MPRAALLVRDRLVAEGGWIERGGVSCFNLYRAPTLEPGDAGNAGPGSITYAACLAITPTIS